MFGLENQKKKKSPEFIFDLEKELMNEKLNRELKQKVEKRIQQVKEVLRTGDSKEEFDLFGILLHGYSSLMKVVLRVPVKK